MSRIQKRLVGTVALSGAIVGTLLSCSTTAFASTAVPLTTPGQAVYPGETLTLSFPNSGTFYSGVTVYFNHGPGGALATLDRAVGTVSGHVVTWTMPSNLSGFQSGDPVYIQFSGVSSTLPYYYPFTGGGQAFTWDPSVSLPTTPTFEAVTLDGDSYQVVANYGYNSEAAVQGGTYSGYIEERAALRAGASFNGEGMNSSYMTAILSGNGVDLNDQNVTPVQQGEFAALYQKLGIIPTWDSTNLTTESQGVAALRAHNAPILAIENYLVQFDGYSWTTAR